MNPNKWSNSFSVATNLTVLAGVLLVAYELRQNTDLARVAAEQSRRDTNQQIEAQILGDNFAVVWEKSILDPGSLTIAEIRQLDAYLAVKLEDVMRTFELEQAGLAETGSTVEHVQRDFPFLFGSSFSKTWWRHEGSTWDWDGGIAETADSVIASIDNDLLEKKFLAIQNDAEQLSRE